MEQKVRGSEGGVGRQVLERSHASKQRSEDLCRKEDMHHRLG